MKTWHEDDSFWETMAAGMFGEDRWTAASQEVDHVIQWFKIEPPATVLDLCCGPGRHSLEPARRMTRRPSGSWPWRAREHAGLQRGAAADSCVL